MLFFAVASGLRSAAQWRRIALAVALTALPVALWAIGQQLGLDPLRGPTDGGRSTATTSSWIYLGTYLVVVGFVISARLGDDWRRARAGEARAGTIGRWAPPAIAVGLLVLLLLGIAAAGSRGPVVGAIAGAALVALLR